MTLKILFFTLLASAMIAPAKAQQSPAPAPSAPAGQPAPAAQPAPAPQLAPAATRAETTAPVQTTAQWRSSKLIGLNVYNDQNEKLGDINEILLDQSGKATGVVIGVGGFLGLGQREIMVNLDTLKFVNEPHRAATTPRTAPTTAPGTTVSGDRPATTAETRPARSATERWYPDHAIMSGVTKDSLKAMPEWKYN
jgi:sporulation protein YlmC with PRC-barrel domain